MPRKSTTLAGPATGPTDTNGDVSMVSNTTSTTSPVRTSTTTTTNKEPTSPSQTKAEGQKAKGGRKSTGATGADEEGTTEKPAKGGKSKGDDLGIDDLLLPRTLISRLARGSLPPNTSLQKDALLALTKSATVFISYLAHTSNSITSRKTIQASDVLEAIRDMELEGIMGRKLEGEIKLFEEGVRGKRKGYRDRVKARESGVSANDGEEGNMEDDEGRQPEAKRAKHSSPDMTQNEDGSWSYTDDNNNPQTRQKSADPSSQLRAEAFGAELNNQIDEEDDDGNDDTTSDADIAEDDEDDAVENEDDEDDEDEDDEENDNPSRNIDGLEMDEEEKNRRKAAMLVPDGRIEIGSDDDDDSD